MITGLALINEVEDRMNWRQTGTLEGAIRPETRKMLRLLNRILASMQTLDDWHLLREDGTIQLVAANESTAYFEITNETATVELGASESTLIFSDSMAGRAIQIGTHKTIYRIDSVQNPKKLTLNRPFLGSTLTEADDELVAYSIVQDRYALPSNYDRPTDDLENFFGTNSIDAVGPNTFLEQRRNRGSTLLVSDPDMFTIYGLDDSETFQIVHFDPYPDEARILNFTYQKDHPTIETDEDRVLFQRSHEAIIIEAMLHLANRDYEDSTKVEAVLRDFMRTINQAQGAGNPAGDKMRFTPNGGHRIAQRMKWGRGGGVDWGSAFDQVNNIRLR
jgi:hypothetical protein